MLIVFFIALALVMLALFLIGWSTPGWAAVKRIRAIDGRPIADLVPGPVEIAGVVSIAGDVAPIVPPSGRPCVAMALQVTAYRRSGKSETVVHREDIERHVPSLLADDAGSVALVDFSHVEIMAPVTITGPKDGLFRSSSLAWLPEVRGGADRIELEERIIEVGEHVMMSGEARIHDATVERNMAPGYRDGMPTTRTTFSIHGTLTSRILVGPGSEPQLLFRAAWPMALLVGGAVLALGYALVIFAIAAA